MMTSLFISIGIKLLIVARSSRDKFDHVGKKRKLDSTLKFALDLPSEVGTFFNVQDLYFAGTQKEFSEKRLYCRQDTVDLLEALNWLMTSGDGGLRVIGPPGVGKSITTWLWVCHQDLVYSKTVLWAHVSPKPPLSFY